MARKGRGRRLSEQGNSHPGVGILTEWIGPEIRAEQNGDQEIHKELFFIPSLGKETFVKAIFSKRLPSQKIHRKL
jgi:hypothetical protein